MVKTVPVNENLPQRGAKISIQAVKEDGTPAGKEIQLYTYPIVIGRVDYHDGIEGISEYQRAIRARDGKDITPIDRIVARDPYGATDIEGICGRWNVRGEQDATHRKYIVINQEGDKVTIAYVQNGLFPIKVRDENSVYTLFPDKKLVLEKGEKVDLHLSGTYTKVGETPSGEWIMESAWLRIKVLSNELYSETL
jgi:hypothetical protein